MLLIDRYLINTLLKYFLIILGFFVAMLLAKEAYNHFLDLLREQFTPIEIFDFILVSILSDVLVLIPVTLFVSIIFTFISLQRSNQIAILKSSGISLFRISAPFFVIASSIAILSYVFSSLFISSVTDKRNNYLQILEPHSFSSNSNNFRRILTYQNDSANRLWFIEAFNMTKHRGSYTVLHQMNSEGIEVGRIIAEKSVYDNDLQTWTFKNGTEVVFDKTNGDPLQTITFSTKQFIDLEESPEDFSLLDEEISSLTISKLKTILSILPTTSNLRLKYEIKYFSYFATPLLSIILVGISIPFLTSGVRNNYMVGPLYAFIAILIFFIIRSMIVAVGLSYQLPALVTAFLPYFIFSLLIIRLYWQK